MKAARGLQKQEASGDWWQCEGRFGEISITEPYREMGYKHAHALNWAKNGRKSRRKSGITDPRVQRIVER